MPRVRYRHLSCHKAFKPTLKMEQTVYQLLKDLRRQGKVVKPLPEIYFRYLRLLLPDCVIMVGRRWHERNLVWLTIKRRSPLD